jgi:2-methylcitrate dehydratase PrpD
MNSASAVLGDKCAMDSDRGEQRLTAYIAEFVASTRYEDLPADLIAKGTNHIFDCVACGLAGAVSEASMISLRYLRDAGCGPGEATVIGSGARLAPRFAAFMNGLSIHGDDFDDTAPQPSKDRNGGMHSTGSVFAAALAVAERDRRSGRDLMEAVHIGVEVACKLNHAVAARHYESGYHATSSINVFGIAAAVARLLRLDNTGVNRALGVAASQSSGLRENFGTMVNPFHSGHAAECGTVAAELVARGLTAATDILEAPRGFFNAAAGGYEADAIMGRLGAPWAFLDPGMWIKPYPCGALTHPAMTALLELAKSGQVAADDIRAVRIQTNGRIANTLIHNRPKNALQAKFSMPFCAAICLVRRQATLAEFTDDVVRDPTIQDMIGRITYTPYERVQADYTNVTTLIEIDTADGRTIKLRADYGKGNPRNQMTFDDIAEKLRGCGSYAQWPSRRLDKIIAAVARLESMDDVRELTDLLGREES